MSPLIRADLPDGPVICTISASNPSSLKKPFCCANGKTIQWTTCCGTPTRIFSAGEAVPLATNKIIAAASTGNFIAHLQFEYGAVTLSKTTTAAKPAYFELRFEPAGFPTPAQDGGKTDSRVGEASIFRSAALSAAYSGSSEADFPGSAKRVSRDRCRRPVSSLRKMSLGLDFMKRS